MSLEPTRRTSYNLQERCTMGYFYKCVKCNDTTEFELQRITYHVSSGKIELSLTCKAIVKNKECGWQHIYIPEPKYKPLIKQYEKPQVWGFLLGDSRLGRINKVCHSNHSELRSLLSPCFNQFNIFFNLVVNSCKS